MMFGPHLTGRDREPGSPRPLIRYVAMAAGLIGALVGFASEYQAVGVGIMLVSLFVATIV